jgi:hypothetical protein
MRSPPSGIRHGHLRACQELLNPGGAGEDAIGGDGLAGRLRICRAADDDAEAAARVQRPDGVLVADVVTSRFWNCQP